MLLPTSLNGSSFVFFFFLNRIDFVPWRAQRIHSLLVAACDDTVKGPGSWQGVSLCAHLQISAEHSRNSVLFFFPLFIDELKAFQIIIFLKLKESDEELEMQTTLWLA